MTHSQGQHVLSVCVCVCVSPCQGYVVCPSEKRFLLLFTFLKKNRKKKLMVFFSSCMSVKYHYELLNYIDLPVMAIHVRAALATGEMCDSMEIYQDSEVC